MSADQVHVQQRVYAHRTYRNILVVEISAENSRNDDVFINITTNKGKDSVDINFSRVNLTDSPGDYEVIYGKVNITEIPGGKRAGVAVVSSIVPAALKVPAKSKMTWYFITSISSSVENEKPIEYAYQQWQKASQYPMSLFKLHSASWREVWDEGRIDVTGDLNLAQSIYASFYNIISSTREDWPHGLSPGGLPGGEEYLGHTFWDQDIWMYPPLVMMHPGLARASLQYRHDHLPAAKEIAKKYKYEGERCAERCAHTGQ